MSLHNAFTQICDNLNRLDEELGKLVAEIAAIKAKLSDLANA